MAAKLRILHVIPSLSASEGGPTSALIAMVTALAQTGVSVTVATTGAGTPRSFSENDRSANIAYLTFARTTLFYKTSWSLTWWLRKHVSDFDCVHIHALFSYSSVIAAVFARKRRVPYIVRPLGVLNRWGVRNRRQWLKRLSIQLLESRILRGATVIHYTTTRERTEAREAHRTIGERDSVVLPIPLLAPESVDSENSEDFAQSHQELKGYRIVLFLGRLDPIKGLDLLLPAFAEARAAFPHWLLVIAGTGDEAFVRSLQKRAEELRLGSEALMWTGHLNTTAKTAALSAADVFVLPSYSESFGIAAAEALASGVATILSSNCGLAEDVSDAGAGIVFECSVPALTAALKRVFEDDQFRDQLAQRGQEFATRFSMEEFGTACVQLYRTALRDANHRRANKWVNGRR